MPRRFLSCLCLAIGLLPFAAPATDLPTYNRVAFSESASTEVDNDLLVVILFAQSEDQDPQGPANEVNQAIDWALAMAADQPRIKTQTLGYQTTPYYRDGKIRGWRVRQSLRLEGADSQALGDLTGRLQARLAVQSVEYTVSDERRRETLKALTDSALGHFTRRAQQTAMALGRSGYRLVRLNIIDGQQNPSPRIRAMAAEAQAAPAPANFAAGRQRLVVSVNGEIELDAE